MDFKYTGQTGYKCMDFVVHHLKEPSDILVNGEIIHIPDDNMDLINRIKVTGLFIEVPKTVKPVKSIKKEKDKEE